MRLGVILSFILWASIATATLTLCAYVGAHQTPVIMEEGNAATNPQP